MCDVWKSVMGYRFSIFPIASRNKLTNFDSHGGSHIGPYIATFDPCTYKLFESKYEYSNISTDHASDE